MNLSRAFVSILFLPALACGGGGRGDQPDGGALCAGEATACEALAVEECSAQLGCSTEMGCIETGDRPTCEDLVGVLDCTSTTRCQFDPASMTCSGTVFDCSVQSLETPCNGEPGCSWGERCVGDVVPCEELTDSAQCGGQLGCEPGFD